MEDENISSLYFNKISGGMWQPEVGKQLMSEQNFHKLENLMNKSPNSGLEATVSLILEPLNTF